MQSTNKQQSNVRQRNVQSNTRQRNVRSNSCRRNVRSNSCRRNVRSNSCQRNVQSNAQEYRTERDCNLSEDRRKETKKFESDFYLIKFYEKGLLPDKTEYNKNLERLALHSSYKLQNIYDSHPFTLYCCEHELKGTFRNLFRSYKSIHGYSHQNVEDLETNNFSMICNMLCKKHEHMPLLLKEAKKKFNYQRLSNLQVAKLKRGKKHYTRVEILVGDKKYTLDFMQSGYDNFVRMLQPNSYHFGKFVQVAGDYVVFGQDDSIKIIIELRYYDDDIENLELNSRINTIEKFRSCTAAVGVYCNPYRSPVDNCLIINKQNNYNYFEKIFIGVMTPKHSNIDISGIKVNLISEDGREDITNNINEIIDNSYDSSDISTHSSCDNYQTTSNNIDNYIHTQCTWKSAQDCLMCMQYQLERCSHVYSSSQQSCSPLYLAPHNVTIYRLPQQYHHEFQQYHHEYQQYPHEFQQYHHEFQQYPHEFQHYSSQLKYNSLLQSTFHNSFKRITEKDSDSNNEDSINMESLESNNAIYDINNEDSINMESSNEIIQCIHENGVNTNDLNDTIFNLLFGVKEFECDINKSNLVNDDSNNNSNISLNEPAPKRRRLN